MSEKTDRRSFLKGLGVVGASVVSVPPVVAAVAHAPAPSLGPAGPAAATAVPRADEPIGVLQGLEQGKIAIGDIPATEFFALLLNTTMEGFFADPVYGGNRNKVAWKMVGFPGVIAIHSTNIKTYRNKRYEAQPMSI